MNIMVCYFHNVTSWYNWHRNRTVGGVGTLVPIVVAITDATEQLPHRMLSLWEDEPANNEDIKGLLTSTAFTISHCCNALCMLCPTDTDAIWTMWHMSRSGVGIVVAEGMALLWHHAICSHYDDVDRLAQVQSAPTYCFVLVKLLQLLIWSNVQ